nr:ribonuclease H-like domain-containing protein [Tanacetum cinerariifolium]
HESEKTAWPIVARHESKKMTWLIMSCVETCGKVGYDPPQMIVIVGTAGTIQTLPSFEEYTPPLTYPEEVEKTLGTPLEVEPLNETKLEEICLNCNHNTPLSSKEAPSLINQSLNNNHYLIVYP